jgi:cystathionine beta-lyase
MDRSTELINHPYRAPDAFEAAMPGIHKASTVLFPTVADMRRRQWTDKSAYTYGLHGTPTTFTLEERLATLEGGRYCVLVPSGLAAIALVDLAFLQPGDEVLLPDNAYGPGRDFLIVEMARWGVKTNVYDALNPTDLAQKIGDRTRLVWLEAAGSITLEFPDVPACVAVINAANAKRPGGARPILSALDNTWGAGIAFQPFDMGVDISMHALTKYPSGGGDVLMGSVITRDPVLHETLQMCHMRLGLAVGANDAELVLRSLPTAHLRYARQDAVTRRLAEWALTRPEFSHVLHPALPESPGHAVWARDCTGAACLFTVVFQPRYSQAQVDAFCDRLQLFGIGYSWAGPQSLVVPYQLPESRARLWPHGCGVVRFAIGLADVQDLQNDLAQSLDAL